MARLVNTSSTGTGAATNTAIKSDGTGAKVTVAVSNALVGESILRFRLTNSAQTDASNIVRCELLSTILFETIKEK